MATTIIATLIKFGETLGDTTVSYETKLRVLDTLSKADLSLSELSGSGVGRAVRKLKSQPGDLGKTARNLLTEWKKILLKHSVQENVELPIKGGDVNSSNTHLKNGKIEQPMQAVPSEKEPLHSECKRKSTPIVAERASKSSKTVHASATPSVNKLNTFPDVPPVTEPTVTNAERNHTTSSTASHNHCAESNKKHRLLLKRTCVTSDASVRSNSSTNTSQAMKGESEPTLDSIDASSGLSFLESLNVGLNSQVSRKKKCKPKNSSPERPLRDDLAAPSKKFTKEILSSLDEPFDRPDIIRDDTNAKSVKPEDDLDFDDGDLKFKSKKILWAPKPNRTACSSDSTGPSFLQSPASLVDFCLDVLQRNLPRVDHVGHVPFELFSRVLRQAPPEELRRIEQCNPQFVGLTDDLWKRHTQRDFHTEKEKSPRSGETWSAFYQRLSEDSAKRLERFIGLTTYKIKKEQEARRTTLPTEAIAPRQFRRRGGRNSSLVNSHPPVRANGDSSEPAFRPYNVSRPVNSPPNDRRPANVPSRGGHNHVSGGGTGGGSGGGLLNKLRKQLRRGRMK